MNEKSINDDLLGELAAKSEGHFRTTVHLRGNVHSMLGKLSKELGISRSMIISVAVTRLYRDKGGEEKKNGNRTT